MTFKKWCQLTILVPLLTLSTFSFASNTLQDIIQNKEQRTLLAKSMSKVKDKASSNLGLAFVFSSTCPYCQTFAPTLEAFAAKNNLTVYPFSADGRGIHIYQQPLMANQNVMTEFFPNQQNIVYPSLFLVNLDTRAHVPLSIGNVPFNVLETTYQAALNYPHLQARLGYE